MKGELKERNRFYTCDDLDMDMKEKLKEKN